MSKPNPLDFRVLPIPDTDLMPFYIGSDTSRPFWVKWGDLKKVIESLSPPSPPGSAAWGSIATGTGVGSQTDLVAYLTSNYYPLSSNPAGYITSPALTAILANYVTNSSLASTLTNYVTTVALSAILSGYVTSGDLAIALTGYVPTSRTITINGVTFDLSADRSWTISGGGGITALTGDVTASGTGSVAATITANAVTFAKIQNIPTQKLLGRGTAGTGNVEEIGLSAAFSIDGSNNLQYANASLVSIYGAGIDGDVTISINTTLVRDMYYNNLTVNLGVVLNTNGYKVYVKGSLTNNGTIGTAGNNGNNGTAPASPGGGGAATQIAAALNTANGEIFINGGGAGNTGGSGTTGNGGSSAAIAAASIYLGGLGGRGGLGGSGSAGSPGNGGLVSSTYNGIDGKRYINAMTESFWLGLYFPFGSIAGSGGGAGAGGGAGTSGGSGGGGGSGVRGVNIHALNFVNTGTIRAIGGNGGNGSAPTGLNAGGGAGGGGGGGGFMYLVYGTLTNSGTITVAGGTGGTGAAGTGTGTAGANGANGGAGTLIQINTTTGTITQS